MISRFDMVIPFFNDTKNIVSVTNENNFVSPAQTIMINKYYGIKEFIEISRLSSRNEYNITGRHGIISLRDEVRKKGDFSFALAAASASGSTFSLASAAILAIYAFSLALALAHALSLSLVSSSAFVLASLAFLIFFAFSLI